jgi:hypothetical protein
VANPKVANNDRPAGADQLGTCLVEAYEQLRAQALSRGGTGGGLGAGLLMGRGMAAWATAWRAVAPRPPTTSAVAAPAAPCPEVVSVLASMALGRLGG